MKIASSILSTTFLLITLHSIAQITILRGPYLQTATANSIVVRWRTNVATQGRVYYGPSATGLNMTQDESAITTDHIVKISNLTAHTKYFYAIASSSTILDNDVANHFYTLPVTGTPGIYRIGVFGDCGNNSVNQRNVRDAFTKYLGTNNLDSWLLLGDNAYDNGIDAQYQSGFFNIYKSSLLRTSPLWPSPGNHEYNNNGVKQLDKNISYYDNFTVPVNGEAGGFPSHSKGYYSFDIGNIHFISLDSYGIDSATRLSDTTGVQARWLKNDLLLNNNRDWVVVYFHHPPYTMGSHNSDTESELIDIRKKLLPILERYSVDVVLAGHSHVYERSGLLKGYYGSQRDFSNAYFLSSSSGVYNGTSNSCPYVKKSNGTVYVVSGSAGQLGGQQRGFPLSAMKYSNSTFGGAVIIEVNGNRMDLKWINTDDKIRDQFTIMKDVNKSSSYSMTEGDTLRLTASFNSTYNWNLLASRSKSILISPTYGDYSFIVKDNQGCISDTFLVEVKPKTDSAIINVEAKYLNKKTVSVTWQYPAFEEANIDHYVIERSVNNVIFTDIASVSKLAISNNSLSSYSYIDSNNIIVRKLYYRIKSVDLSGNSRYSKSVVVNFNGLNLNDNIIIAPNPSYGGDFKIKFIGGIGVASINIYDMTGRRYYSASLPLNAIFRQLMPIKLPHGMYVVVINIDDDTVSKRILVL